MGDFDLKIAMVQDRPGSGIREKYLKALDVWRPDIISFPEYYFVRPEEGNVIVSGMRQESNLMKAKNWSIQFDCLIVAGTMVTESNGKLFNRCHLVNEGKVVGYYDKIHPFRNEGRGLIQKGIEYKAFDILGLRIGILICADVLYPHTFDNLKGLRPDIIIIPTTSPYRENESPKVKFVRDRKLFVRGAEITGAIIFKVCASGSIGRQRFQARSLVATPDGIAWRNPPSDEDKSILVFSNLRKRGSDTRLDTDVLYP